MDFNEYVPLAVSTENKNNPVSKLPFNSSDRLQHATMGMITEVGELVDIYKCCLYYGELLDHINIKEELGDLCWYLALAADVLKLEFDPPLKLNQSTVSCLQLAIQEIAKMLDSSKYRVERAIEKIRERNTGGVLSKEGVVG